MAVKKLVRKGSALRDQEGNLLLVNEDNQAYVVDESVAAIWNMCEGKTVEELTNIIATSIGREPEELKSSVEDLISRLMEVKLVA